MSILRPLSPMGQMNFAAPPPVQIFDPGPPQAQQKQQGGGGLMGSIMSKFGMGGPPAAGGVPGAGGGAPGTSGMPMGMDPAALMQLFASMAG